ncbi:LysR family transcriptional regulator [Lacisediminimonas sp.]|uniref:LysR family transcriptional regulator n=1 Tax=Lacisediminimonas sp. TaxID=3060582 RepID=UPI00271D876D|nr:LysR family transcriptional regulator [Lacisediminimonas sp.]MDO8298153.1 LysR family transcriptional regulator [Lacisediminimonas sp.]MDO9216627.1 LysR family transcriptional regulator [Lacisediminimonas sp.]
MRPEPNDLLLFAHIVETGSFSRAALRLGVPKSTVSRRLANLEAQLGERLLLRTTRKLTLTDFGMGVLEHARGVQNEVEAAQSLAQHRQSAPSGRLRVSMPGDLANTVLAKMLSDFVNRYSAISLELDLSPRRVDLVGENFDCALRMGALPDDATLAARRIAAFSGGLYAAPGYLARQGEPAEPEALMGHSTLRLLRRNGEAEQWILNRGEQVWEGAPPARAVINSPELLIRMAILGAGIAAVADHYAEPYVTSGELRPVLPDWRLPVVTAWAVFPGRRLMPARTRVFIDAVQAQFDSPQCQAVEERVARGRANAREASGAEAAILPGLAAQRISS